MPSPPNLFKQISLLIFMLCLAACGSNVLRLHNTLYYTEYNFFSIEDPITLTQRVSYNRPGVIDGGFTHDLTFIFTDTTRAKEKKVLFFAADSSIVKAHYDLGSVWNWENEDYQLTGSIEILQWEDSSITLQENITITQPGKEILRYKGKRKFLREKKD